MYAQQAKILLCLRFELSKISMTLLKGNAFACKLLKITEPESLKDAD